MISCNFLEKASIFRNPGKQARSRKNPHPSCNQRCPCGFRQSNQKPNKWILKRKATSATGKKQTKLNCRFSFLFSRFFHNHSPFGGCGKYAQCVIQFACCPRHLLFTVRSQMLNPYLVNTNTLPSLQSGNLSSTEIHSCTVTPFAMRSSAMFSANLQDLSICRQRLLKSNSTSFFLTSIVMPPRKFLRYVCKVLRGLQSVLLNRSILEFLFCSPSVLFHGTGHRSCTSAWI